MAPNPTQARAGAHESWARTADRAARTANGRAAALARFERLVDPEGRLPIEERLRRAESAKRAHFLRMAEKSAASRRRKNAAEASRVASSARPGRGGTPRAESSGEGAVSDAPSPVQRRAS